MKNKYIDLLTQNGATCNRDDLDEVVQALDALSARMAVLLGHCDPSTWEAMLAEFSTRVLTVLRPSGAGVHKTDGRLAPDAAVPKWENLTPELLEWVRRQFTEEEIVAGIREIQATGGLELRDFIHELEEAATPDE